MEMESYKFTDDLLEYYGGQIFKMLGLFEIKDANGYKHAIKIRSEMGKLPFQVDEINDDYRFGIVLAKLDNLIEELFYLDGDHQYVKNHVMESCNMINDIREGLK